MSTGFLACLIADDLHCGPIGRASIRDDNMRFAVSLHCFLEEFQRSSLISLLRDIGFQDFAFMIHCAPEVVSLASDVGYACLRLTKTSSRCHRHCGLLHIESERRLLILCAKYVPNRSTQSLTLSWQISMPRSSRRSSTFRSEIGNLTYISTPSWMISGDVLK